MTRRPLSTAARPHALLVALCLSSGALLVPDAAHAGSVVLAPMLPTKSIKPERIEDLFSLMSSELEFMVGVSEVLELDPAPPALKLSCLESTRCLAAITSERGGDMMLAGTVKEEGSVFTLDLLLFDVAENKTVRRNTFLIGSEPAQLVTEITPILIQTVTGRTPAAEQEETMEAVSFDDEGDGFAFAPAPVPVADPSPPPRTTASARAVDVKIQAPPPPPPPEEEEEEFDPNAFSFDNDASDISFGSGSGEATKATPPPPPPPAPIYEDPDYVNLDEDIEPTTSSSTTKSDDDTHRWRRLHIAVRGGYSNYSVFNFAAINAEVQVRTVGGLFIAAGVDIDIVSRCVERDANDPTQLPAAGCATVDTADQFTVRTDIIVPFNLGILYRFKEGRFQPYIGVDGNVAVIRPATAGTVNPQGETLTEGTPTALTGGARLRGGFDFFVSRNFGFNLDAGLGFWMSDAWPQIDIRVPTIGFQPTIRGGIVLAF